MVAPARQRTRPRATRVAVNVVAHGAPTAAPLIVLEIYRFAFNPLRVEINKPHASSSVGRSVGPVRARIHSFPLQPSRVMISFPSPLHASSSHRSTRRRLASAHPSRASSRSRDPVVVHVVVVVAVPRSFERAPQSEAEMRSRKVRPSGCHSRFYIFESIRDYIFKKRTVRKWIMSYCIYNVAIIWIFEHHGRLHSRADADFRWRGGLTCGRFEGL